MAVADSVYSHFLPGGNHGRNSRPASFIEQSKCTFIRNGKQHNGSEARGHIETKYDYFKKKISTTEDFITYAATKSVMSGKPYRVLCSGKEMNLADWLQAGLDNLRTR